MRRDMAAIVDSVRQQRREKLEPLSVEDTITLVEGIRNIKSVLAEADQYLDTNHLTSIGHGSILHQRFKEAQTW